MLSMTQINGIKYLKQIQGLSYEKIKEITGHSYKTIKKYEETDDFNLNIAPKAQRKKKIDQYKDLVDKWLDSDIGKPHKQRHTAKRIYARLQEKFQDELNIAYRTLAKYVAAKKQELNLDSNQYLKLNHLPGAAQVDFGKVSFVEKGNETKGSILVLTLPYSNAGYMQMFRGETTECLLQGLKNVFEHLGAVPREIWFDNLSAAVLLRHKRDRILNDSFQRFCAHFNFKPIFCNPASGNEKGNVENKVGYFRRNFLVPIPEINSIDEFNRELLVKCDKDNSRKHYLKGKSIADLAAVDREYMLPINTKDFDIFKLMYRKINKYGMIEVDTNKYSVSPSLKNQEVLAKVSAHKIEILNKDHKLLISHDRHFGRNNYVSTSWMEHLPLIIKKIRALEATDFFQSLPEIWRKYLKSLSDTHKRKALKVLEKILINSSIEVAIHVLQQVLDENKSDPEIILLYYHSYMERNSKIEDLELEEHVPKINEFNINFEVYDALIKRKGDEG